jgi:hypothetical protein
VTFPTRRRGARKWSCHGQSRNWSSRIVAPARSFTIGEHRWGPDGFQLTKEGGTLVLHLAVAVTVSLSSGGLPRDAGAGIHKPGRRQGLPAPCR